MPKSLPGSYIIVRGGLTPECRHESEYDTKQMPQILMTQQKYIGLDNGQIMRYYAHFISVQVLYCTYIHMYVPHTDTTKILDYLHTSRPHLASFYMQVLLALKYRSED